MFIAGMLLKQIPKTLKINWLSADDLYDEFCFQKNRDFHA